MKKNLLGFLMALFVLSCTEVVDESNRYVFKDSTAWALGTQKHAEISY